MKLSKLTFTGAAAGLAALTILLSTDPKRVSVGMLVVPPVLVMLSMTILGYQLLGKLPKFSKGSYQARRLLLAVFSAGVPVLLVILQSVNQLTAKDLILLAVLLALLGLYFNRFSLNVPSE